MYNETDHKEPLDHFSEYMKQRLENHPLPLDEACWDEIEPRMKFRNRNFGGWIGSAVAVAVVAILLLFIPFQAEKESDSKRNERVALSGEKKEDIREEKDSVDEPAMVTPVQKSPRMKTLIAAVPIEVIDSLADELLQPAKTEDVPDQKESQVVEESHNNHSGKKNFYFAANPTKKKRAKWLLAASFSTGGHISLTGLSDQTLDMDSNPGSGFPPIVSPPLTNEGALPLSEYTNVNTSLPLSFGITVRKDFNRYIGLETGLIYTYLTSQLSKSDRISYHSRLDLHYLGIPVNLVLNLSNTPKWNVYLAGGILFEKGLRSKLRQENFLRGNVSTLYENKPIGGVQWSLNGSLGISYRLYKEWSIYVEPRISYYFDNDQPISIRTENTVIFGMGAGVRYEF